MKKLLFAILYVTRFTRLVAWFNRNKITILCYHSVTKRRDTVANDPFKMHLKLELFLKHLDHLQAHYQIISLSELFKARRENRKLPPNSVVLSFDDGFRNYLTVVAPVLLERGLPATCFIVTDECVARNNSGLGLEWVPKDDNRHLSWGEVRELSLRGLEFGSHTCSHPRLLNIPAEAVQRELEESRSVIAAQCNRKELALSFPHGQTSPAISRLAQTLGYACAVTTTAGQNAMDTDLFALNRTVVSSSDDLATFAARVSGLTFWAGRLRSLRGAGVRGRRTFGSSVMNPRLVNRTDT